MIRILAFILAVAVPSVHAAVYEELVNNVVGFGQNTTGGLGGTLCEVTNLNDSGAGSLRECAESVGAKWIKFNLSGTINLTSDIIIKSNKTIDGRGQNIVLKNQGIYIGTYATVNPANNVIIHNITIQTSLIDSIHIGEDAYDIWIDHVTIDTPGDEGIFIGSSNFDAADGAPAKDITLSWNRHLKGTCSDGICHGILIVRNSGITRDAAITATIHHNHFETYVRHPFVRFAKVHSFNNYLNETHLGIEARTDSQIYSEKDIFKFKTGFSANPLCKSDGGQAWTDAGDSPGANLKCLNPWLINGATIQERNPATIFNPSSFYSYTPDAADAALQSSIIAGAGWQDVPFPSEIPGVYQAEDAVAGGGVVIQSDIGCCAGFNGTGYANFPSTGGTLAFNNVDGGAGGSKTLIIRFALGVAARTGELVVNGATTGITFPTTGAWTAWQDHEVVVTLTSGATNTIQLNSTGQDLPITDQIAIGGCHLLVPPPPDPPAFGFSHPWNVYTDALTQTALCNENDTVSFAAGDGAATTLVWKNGAYTKNGTAWQPTIEFAGPAYAGTNWIVGAGTFTTPVLTTQEIASKNYMAAYVCTFQSGGWKCGCADSGSCTQNGKWGLQAWKKGQAIAQDFLSGPAGSYVTAWDENRARLTEQASGSVGSNFVGPLGVNYTITGGTVRTVAVGGDAQVAVNAAVNGDQVVLLGGNYGLIEFRSKTGVDLTCAPGATCSVLQIESLSGTGQTHACNDCGISNIRTQSASVGPWMHFGKVGTKSGLRIVGNHAEDVGGSSSGALITIKSADSTKILVNTSLNTGVSGFNTAQNIYMGGEAVNAGLEIAWNKTQNHLGGRHIQIYGHTCGEKLTGLKIHNNEVFNDPGFVGGGNTGILVSHSDCAAGTNQAGDGWIVDANVHDNLVHDIANGNGIRYETSDLTSEPGTFATTTNNVIYNTGDSPIQVSYAKGNISSGNCMEGAIDWKGPKASAYAVTVGGAYSSTNDLSTWPSCG